jgi:hypothetical protein
MVAPIERGATFQSGTPRVLFEGVYNLRSDSLRSYDVDPASGRLLMIRPAERGATAVDLRHAQLVRRGASSHRRALIVSALRSETSRRCTTASVRLRHSQDR